MYLPSSLISVCYLAKYIIYVYLSVSVLILIYKGFYTGVIERRKIADYIEVVIISSELTKTLRKSPCKD